MVKIVTKHYDSTGIQPFSNESGKKLPNRRQPKSDQRAPFSFKQN